MLLNLIQIWDQIMDYLGPSLVEGLVPDGGCVGGRVEGIGLGANEGDAVIVQSFTLGGDDEIHLMDEDVNSCAR